MVFNLNDRRTPASLGAPWGEEILQGLLSSCLQCSVSAEFLLVTWLVKGIAAFSKEKKTLATQLLSHILNLWKGKKKAALLQVLSFYQIPCSTHIKRVIKDCVVMKISALISKNPDMSCLLASEDVSSHTYIPGWYLQIFTAFLQNHKAREWFSLWAVQPCSQHHVEDGKWGVW